MARTTPTKAPPRAKAGNGASTGAAGTTEPELLTDETLAEVLEADAEASGRPTLDPTVAGEGAQAAAVAAVTGTWRTNQTVTALWSINEVRNAWMYVSGLGWRKLYNGRDGAFRALVALASHARQTGRPISFREEADGMVYEIYAW
jgi:hypothetical protein